MSPFEELPLSSSSNNKKPTPSGKRRKKQMLLSHAINKSPAASGPNKSLPLVHLGLFLVFSIVAVYVYGVMRSANALPEIIHTHVLGLFRPFKGSSEADVKNVLKQTTLAAEKAIAPMQAGGTAQAVAGAAAKAVQNAAGAAALPVAGVLNVNSIPKPQNQPAAAVANQQQQQQQNDALSKIVWTMTPPQKKSPPPTIPSAKWPVSIRWDEMPFETIAHPGDPKSKMQVPHFWSDPVHNLEFFSREKAMKIGSCIEPDAQGNYARGDSCPREKRTVFVAIASYRDWQCRYTVESIFGRAKHPERVRVGVVDQIVDGEDSVCNAPIEPCDKNATQALCKFKDQLDVYQMDAILAVGPVFARHVGHRMYRGEYYAMQSDAHVTYTTDWDVDIIDQQESTHNDMAVLSTYLTDIIGSVDPKTGRSLRHTRPIMCNTDYEGGQQGQHLRHMSQPERPSKIAGSPQLQPYWAAGFSFSRGHFVVNVPYDQYQPMIFQGEEMSIGIRGFTIGYDYYSPERSVCFHHYAHGQETPGRNRVKHFWENAPRYQGTGIKAMSRLLGIVHMNPETSPSSWIHTEEDRYGLGAIRTPEKFYETFGIDVIRKKTEHHLCNFVDTTADMHKEFIKQLRPDGMGIDYSKINYKFKDPFLGQK